MKGSASQRLPEVGNAIRELTSARQALASGDFENARVLSTHALSLLEQTKARLLAGGRKLPSEVEGPLELLLLWARSRIAHSLFASGRQDEAHVFIESCPSSLERAKLLAATAMFWEQTATGGGWIAVSDEALGYPDCPPGLKLSLLDLRMKWRLEHSEAMDLHDLRVAAHLAESNPELVGPELAQVLSFLQALIGPLNEDSPPRDRISSLLGNCSGDSGDLECIMRLLSAVLLYRAGAEPSARGLLQSLPANNSVFAKMIGRLFQLWLLPLSDKERKLMSSKAVAEFEAEGLAPLARIAAILADPPKENVARLLEAADAFMPRPLRLRDTAAKNANPSSPSISGHESFDDRAMLAFDTAMASDEVPAYRDAAELLDACCRFDRAAACWGRMFEEARNEGDASAELEAAQGLLGSVRSLLLLGVDDPSTIEMQTGLFGDLCKFVGYLLEPDSTRRPAAAILAFQAALLAKSFSLLAVSRRPPSGHDHPIYDDQAPGSSARRHSALTTRQPQVNRALASWNREAADISSALPQNVAGIEYLLTDDELFAFVVTSCGVHVVRTPWGTSQRTELEWFRQHPLHRLRPADSLGLCKALSVMYDSLVAPVLPHVQGSASIVLAPGARLGVVPLQALSPDLRHTPPLSLAYDISHLLSLGQVPLLAQASAVTSDEILLLRGDDSGSGLGHLANADSEIVELARIAGGAGLVVTVGDRARLLGMDGGARAIHYAGHAAFDPADPMSSAIFLEGRKVSATDLLGADFSKVGLVVLSACETGRSGENTGDEYLGFLRALFARGCRGALCTQWRVDDGGSSVLMAAVYEHWLRGATVPRALREAVRPLIEAKRPPALWAGFTYFGLP